MWYCDKIKRYWKLGMVHADLFLHKLVPKIEVWEVSGVVLVSSKKRTVGVVIGTKFWSIQVQCCKTKTKKKEEETGIINMLFSYFTWEIYSKATSNGYTNTSVGI